MLDELGRRMSSDGRADALGSAVLYFGDPASRTSTSASSAAPAPPTSGAL